MDAAKLKEILRKEYGIKSDEEFNLVFEEFPGIDIGIFTTPLMEKGRKGCFVGHDGEHPVRS